MAVAMRRYERELGGFEPVPEEIGLAELDDGTGNEEFDAEEDEVTGKPALPVQAKTVEEPQCLGLSMKWVSLLALTLQTSGQAILIKWSKTGSSSEVRYLSSTAVFLVEVTKVTTSLCLVFYDVGWTQGLQDLKQNFAKEPAELMKAAVPSLIYTLQNNLMFYSLEMLSAPVQQVIYQMKVVTTAGIGVLMLGKKLTTVQWTACFILSFGIMMVQWPRDSANIGGAQGVSNSDRMKGVAAVLCACLTSGFAGVWIQRMLQQTAASVWMRNVQLGLFGSFMGLGIALVQDGQKISEGGFLQGYNLRVVAVIAMTAFGGLLCAVMLKYAGATHGCFSTALSIVLTNLLSKAMFDEWTADLLALLGTASVIGASLLFALGLPSVCSRGDARI